MLLLFYLPGITLIVSCTRLSQIVPASLSNHRFEKGRDKRDIMFSTCCWQEPVRGESKDCIWVNIFTSQASQNLLIHINL